MTNGEQVEAKEARRVVGSISHTETSASQGRLSSKRATSRIQSWCTFPRRPRIQSRGVQRCQDARQLVTGAQGPCPAGVATLLEAIPRKGALMRKCSGARAQSRPSARGIARRAAHSPRAVPARTSRPPAGAPRPRRRSPASPLPRRAAGRPRRAVTARQPRAPFHFHPRAGPGAPPAPAQGRAARPLARAAARAPR